MAFISAKYSDLTSLNTSNQSHLLMNGSSKHVIILCCDLLCLFLTPSLRRRMCSCI